MNVPSDLKYTKTHEWVKLQGGVATVGITDYAQSEMGDIVFVELPAIGRSVSSSEPLGSVESVKTVSDLYAPFAGEVVEVNNDLGSHSEYMNEDPYGKGWVLKLKLDDEAEAGKLMDSTSYSATLES